MMRHTVADLFSGCGGFSLGFAAHQNFELRLVTDIWSQALQTLQHNDRTVECLTADLSNRSHIDAVVERLGCDLDVLLGGPPCQGFSTLGKRRDNDQRSTLVDSFAEICLRVLPKIIVVENVRGITSKRHPTHTSFAHALINALSSGGSVPYKCSSTVLNVADYGAPQNRVRWLLIAVRSDLPQAEYIVANFWQTLARSKVLTPTSLRSAISDLPRLASGEEARRYVDAAGSARTISNHKAMRHSQALIERLKHVPIGGGLPDVPPSLLTPHLRKMLEGGYGSGGHVKNIYGRMDWGKPSGTIVAGIDKITCGRFIHPEDNRLLTPRECARLQTFPDNFEFLGGQVAQYYQIGNAVPPILSALIAKTLSTFLCNQHETTSDVTEQPEFA